MEVQTPLTLAEALDMKAARPEATPIAGGTDLMVGINFGRLRPEAMIDLTRVRELQTISEEDGWIRLGAGVTYARIGREMKSPAALLAAARSVGSPQIRERGTVGGNLGTASPAGDALPVLAAYDAEIELASAARGSRRVPWREFLVGPKRTALLPDELILAARWRLHSGPSSFSKVGSRNAMVIAVAGLSLVADTGRREVRVALGSVGPTILRAPEAESQAAAALTEAGAWDEPAPLADSALAEFGRLVAAAARPIDDVRGTADYRRHACEILARRALGWALEDMRPQPGVAA